MTTLQLILTILSLLVIPVGALQVYWQRVQAQTARNQESTRTAERRATEEQARRERFENDRRILLFLIGKIENVTQESKKLFREMRELTKFRSSVSGFSGVLRFKSSWQSSIDDRFRGCESAKQELGSFEHLLAEVAPRFRSEAAIMIKISQASKVRLELSRSAPGAFSGKRFNFIETILLDLEREGGDLERLRFHCESMEYSGSIPLLEPSEVKGYGPSRLDGISGRIPLPIDDRYYRTINGALYGKRWELNQ